MMDSLGRDFSMREVNEEEIEKALLRGQVDVVICQLQLVMEEQTIKKQREEMTDALNGIGVR